MKLVEYSAQELFDIAVETIKYGKKKYHPYYDETVKKAKFLKQIMTGDDQRELLIRYKDKEDDEQKDQRVKVTNSRTQYASGRVWSVFSEVQRSDNVVEVIKYEEDNEAAKSKLGEIHARLKRFHGHQSAIQYLYEALRRLNFYDPNAFIVINFTDFDYLKGKTEYVYPVEVYSHQAVKYEYSNGILVYLFFYQDYTYTAIENDKQVEKVAKKWYMYAEDLIFEFIEVPEDKIDREPQPGYDVILIPKEHNDKGQPNKDMKPVEYHWIQYDTASKQIPVFQAGYLKSAKHEGKIFESPLAPAEKLFHDLIFTKSEYDLAKAMHWFYQKFIYAPPCEYKHHELGQCHSGYFEDGTVCPNCDGTGMEIHRTVQDVIAVRMPHSFEEIVPLTNMVHYENIDISIGEHLKQDFRDLEKDIFKAVFNSQAFDRSEIQVTATEKNLDLRAVKNALVDFGDHISRVYTYTVKQTAIFLDNDEGLIVQHKHPRDFKFESIDELIVRRQNAINASAPYEVIRQIDLALMEMQHQDDPEAIEMMEAVERHKPFREKSEQERMFVLSQLAKTDFHRVLWTYFEDIMRDAAEASTQVPFYMLPFDRQRVLVEQAVEAKIEEIKEQQEEMMAQRGPLGQALGQPREE